jgi:hypothetical protein
MEFTYRRNVAEPWINLRLSDGYGSGPGSIRYVLHIISDVDLENAYSAKVVWQVAIEEMVRKFNTLGKKVKVVEYDNQPTSETVKALPLPYGIGIAYWEEPTDGSR